MAIAGTDLVRCWWDRLPVLKLRLRFQPLKAFRVREHPGSMFRGAFGHSLKNLLCVRHHRNCAGCDLALSCGYTQVFEPHRRPPGEAVGPSRPPPAYLIEWDPSLEGAFVGTDPFEIDFVLIAHATDHAHLVAPVFADAARVGFGPDRVPHRLLDVRQILSDGRPGDGAFRPERIHDHPLPVSTRTRKWRLDSVTPIHLKERGAASHRPGLEAFLRATERRLRLFAQVGDLDLPKRVDESLFDAARRARSTDSSFRWERWQRFSARQHSKVPVDGANGSIHFDQPFAPFASLLRAATIVHVGSKTAIGLGRIAIRRDGASAASGTSEAST